MTRGISYTENSVVPLEGEIILMRFPFQDVYFPYGPASHLAPSLPYTIANSSIGRITKSRGQLRFVLVLTVFHDTETKEITLSVMPIAAYSEPKEDPSWNADRWMSEETRDIQRLHHLPIPAKDWTPCPSPSPDAPMLFFKDKNDNAWKCHRPSWVAVVRVTCSISEDFRWHRRSAGPVILDGGEDSITDLITYLEDVIPSFIEEAAAASPDIIIDTAINTNTDIFCCHYQHH